MTDRRYLSFFFFWFHTQYSLSKYRHLNVYIPVILVVGILTDETSGVAGVVEEVMEVLAPILTTLGIIVEVEVPIPGPEVISSEKERESSATFTDIDKEIEPSLGPISEEMMIESLAELLATASEPMVTGQEVEPSTPVFCPGGGGGKLLVHGLNFLLWFQNPCFFV